MFEREHHRRVARVLSSLDAQRLHACQCLFGGGTALALRYGEYRESVDIDFVVSHLEGYRSLRQSLSGAAGLLALCHNSADMPPAFTQTRELRADQYGLRTLVRVDEVEIKFEIVLEARIALVAPATDDLICGVATLSRLDAAACKLLANSDRWADDAMLSRDLIDLAMMALPKPLLQDAVAKAAAAYGSSIVADLRKAVQRLRDRPQRLEHCMQALRMDSVPKALLWKRIKSLEV